jgi:hypothetical protein
MRACWIDTSSMFRTLEGFFDTARLTLARNKPQPISWDAAQKWARYDAPTPTEATAK